MIPTLSTPLNLPSGTTLPNRIIKAAMSEGIADAHNDATPRLETLYRRWAQSGAGMLLTGMFRSIVITWNGRAMSFSTPRRTLPRSAPSRRRGPAPAIICGCS